MQDNTTNEMNKMTPTEKIAAGLKEREARFSYGPHDILKPKTIQQNSEFIVSVTLTLHRCTKCGKFFANEHAQLRENNVCAKCYECSEMKMSGDLNFLDIENQDLQKEVRRLRRKIPKVKKTLEGERFQKQIRNLKGKKKK